MAIGDYAYGKANTIREGFKFIGDAIRDRYPTGELIAPIDMPDWIASIPGGGGGGPTGAGLRVTGIAMSDLNTNDTVQILDTSTGLDYCPAIENWGGKDLIGGKSFFGSDGEYMYFTNTIPNNASYPTKMYRLPLKGSWSNPIQCFAEYSDRIVIERNILYGVAGSNRVYLNLNTGVTTIPYSGTTEAISERPAWSRHYAKFKVDSGQQKTYKISTFNTNATRSASGRVPLDLSRVVYINSQTIYVGNLTYTLNEEIATSSLNLITDEDGNGWAIVRGKAESFSEGGANFVRHKIGYIKLGENTVHYFKDPKNPNEFLYDLCNGASDYTQQRGMRWNAEGNLLWVGLYENGLATIDKNLKVKKYSNIRADLDSTPANKYNYAAMFGNYFYNGNKRIYYLGEGDYTFIPTTTNEQQGYLGYVTQPISANQTGEAIAMFV